ncbi:TPM domain-containing protein [Adhaeribacter terreus]|uniref:TPM domain-containing protein n=1 Tax=Adhaeribacter terreus TaxID=529703 RepID=A0ABW0EDJ2_9BACT
MRDIITEDQEKEIVEAIAQAEANTSGEIRVHIENNCQVDPLDRAVEVFASLHMHQTKLRNGVLFYVALKSHKFAVIGDAGINAVVPDNFWDETKTTVLSEFKNGNYGAGLVKGILMAGEQLRTFFPHDPETDTNELHNDVSFGE